MARLKRLTRSQKVLHSKLLKGAKFEPDRDVLCNLQALELHGLAKHVDGKWFAVEKPKPELAGTKRLEELKRKYK